MNIKITLIEELLGSANSDPKIHEEFIASKAPDARSVEEEVAALGAEAVIGKVMTVFHRHNDSPSLFDYQIKGFFKDACSMLARVAGTKSTKIKAFRKVIDGLVFVEPRIIMLVLPSGGQIGSCQRPLRAQTAQGERITLANSETVPPGTTIEFTITLLDESHKALVHEWLDYGRLRGLGVWRNSGKGRFSWIELE